MHVPHQVQGKDITWPSRVSTLAREVQEHLPEVSCQGSCLIAELGSHSNPERRGVPEVCQGTPDHVLTSRYVDRWKAYGCIWSLAGGVRATRLPPGESQWPGAEISLVCGWLEGPAHSPDRACRAYTFDFIYVSGLQLAASRKWVAFGKDAKTAFLQSRPTTRVQKLACKMPADEAFEGYSPEQLILLLTESLRLGIRPSLVEKIPTRAVGQGAQVPSVRLRQVHSDLGWAP